MMDEEYLKSEEYLKAKEIAKSSIREMLVIHDKAAAFDALKLVIKDPPVYSIPFLGDASPHVQDYIKRMDAWYCKLLSIINGELRSEKP